MTSTSAPLHRPGGAAPRDLRRPGAWVTLVVVAVVTVSAVRAHQFDVPPVAAVGAAGLGAWTAWTSLPSRRLRSACTVVGALAGAIAAGCGSTVLVAPAVAAIVVVVGSGETPLGAAIALSAGTILTFVVSAALAHLPLPALLLLLGVLAFGVLLGVTRRSRALATERERALLIASIDREREAARAALLEDRAAVARDIHDVLAHGLGGLVLQLDAIDALLERGRVADAASRVVAARALAADGLVDARRAVAALRDPSAQAAPAVPDDALDRLVAAHRALGATVRVDGVLSLAGLDAAHRGALVRAVQEALTNARRHAPGIPARITARRSAGAFELEVRTARPASPVPSPGGGHGVAGMAERFRSLGDGSVASAGPDGSDFVVSARAVTP